MLTKRALDVCKYCTYESFPRSSWIVTWVYNIRMNSFTFSCWFLLVDTLHLWGSDNPGSRDLVMKEDERNERSLINVQLCLHKPFCSNKKNLCYCCFSTGKCFDNRDVCLAECHRWGLILNVHSWCSSTPYFRLPNKCLLSIESFFFNQKQITYTVHI